MYFCFITFYYFFYIEIKFYLYGLKKILFFYFFLVRKRLEIVYDLFLEKS